MDPNSTRYLVGSVLSEGTAPVNEDMVKKFMEKNFKIVHLPEVNASSVAPVDSMWSLLQLVCFSLIMR